MAAFSFIGKRILIISPEPWDYIKVSKHHYALQLAALKNHVYFLNPPEKSFAGIQAKNLCKNLTIIDYKDPYVGVRFLPRPIRKLLNNRLYCRLQDTVASNFDVVFLFENSRFYDLDFLPANVVSIYFQVDEDQNFHPAEAAKSANLAIAINSVIKDILSRHRQTVYQIGHGYSGRFTDLAIAYYEGRIRYIQPKRRLRAYYIGNLDNCYIDTNLILELVRSNEVIDFLFVGPYSANGLLFRELNQLPNVRFAGAVPADHIPELLDDADLLFFAYRPDFLSSSHKAMEYLASGKAIVTTNIGGYPDDPDLFFHVTGGRSFLAVFQDVCNNIEQANSVDKMRKRISFAMNNTYSQRVRQIEELIQSSNLN